MLYRLRGAMKRYLIPIVIILMLASGLATSCAPTVQTFNKYGISFEVSKELKLEEYSVSIEDQIFRKGTASYEEGCVMSTEKNFTLLWLTTVPEFTHEEIRLSILTTPSCFESASGTFQAEITGDLSTQQIGGFEVTSAKMQFTLPGWKAPGISAVWYCPASQRTIQLILINRHGEREMRRFIRSFSCASPNSSNHGNEGSLSQSEILGFARAIWLVERERDDLMVEHQDFNEKLMDMPTATVFQKTDDFVKRSGKLKETIVSMKAPETESATAVHTRFMLAYAAEYKAYFEWRTAVLSADLNKLNDAIRLFYQADALFEEAYEAMDKMLKEFGLKWQDIK